mgnify:CR=1 FL=1
MKERVAKLLNTNVDSMWIGTFHSICVRILRRDIDKIGYERSFTIYDRDDQITLIRECIKELDVDIIVKEKLANCITYMKKSLNNIMHWILMIY